MRYNITHTSCGLHAAATFGEAKLVWGLERHQDLGEAITKALAKELEEVLQQRETSIRVIRGRGPTRLRDEDNLTMIEPVRHVRLNILIHELVAKVHQQMGDEGEEELEKPVGDAHGAWSRATAESLDNAMKLLNSDLSGQESDVVF